MSVLPAGLAGAIQFLTRVPVRTDGAVPHAPGGAVVPHRRPADRRSGRRHRCRPARARAHRRSPATLAVVLGLLITGAFHEDGLADIADAFGGGWTVEQRLEILKDSRHGTYGVAALCSSILVRVVSAASITTGAALFAGFVAAHVLGRSFAVVAMRLAPPARQSGLGVDAARELRVAPHRARSRSSGSGRVVALTGWWAVVLARCRRRSPPARWCCSPCARSVGSRATCSARSSRSSSARCSSPSRGSLRTTRSGGAEAPADGAEAPGQRANSDLRSRYGDCSPVRRPLLRAPRRRRRRTARDAVRRRGGDRALRRRRQDRRARSGRTSASTSISGPG